MANVDLKSLFTSEKQYTVLQLIKALIDATDKAILPLSIKSATINQDTDKNELSVTITFDDEHTISASTSLISLTSEEKSFISKLITNINAVDDGMTFLKVVGFEGNETHKGNEIHQGYASFLGDENHGGTETHKGNVSFAGDVNIHTNGDISNLVAYEADTFLLKPTHIKANNTDLENIVCYEADTIFEKPTQFKNSVLFNTSIIQHTTSSGTYNINFPQSNSTLATIDNTKISRHNIIITSSDYPNLKVFFTFFNHSTRQYTLSDVIGYLYTEDTSIYNSATGTVNGDDFVIGLTTNNVSYIRILRTSNDLLSIERGKITVTDQVYTFA